LHVLRDPVWIERMTRSLKAVDELDLKPHVGKVFPAQEAGAAHAFLETKKATGKVLLAW
jgi:NADPH:quinone reductase-like Zn-dependent oxidoreductase